MKNLKKAEIAVIALTIACVVFTAGFFIGRGSSGGIVTIEKLAMSGIISSQPPTDAAAQSAASVESEAGEAAQDESGEAAVPSDATVLQYSPPPSAAQNEQADKININTASADLLDTLPGIGEVLAGRIIEYREANGGFKSIEEITAVSGIGEKKFGDIKDMITVG